MLSYSSVDARSSAQESSAYETSGRLLPDLPPLNLAVFAQHVPLCGEGHFININEPLPLAQFGSVACVEMNACVVVRIRGTCNTYFSDINTKRKRAARAALRVCCCVLAPGTSLLTSSQQLSNQPP